MHYYATCCRLLYLKYSHMTPKSLLPTKSLFRPLTLTNVPILYYFFILKNLHICTKAYNTLYFSKLFAMQIWCGCVLIHAYEQILYYA